MKPDPDLRTDCAKCGKQRGVQQGKKGEYHRLPAFALMIAADPFCSANCCRRWHGVKGQTTTGLDEDERSYRHEAAA